MSRFWRAIGVVAIVISACACGGGSPTSPTGSSGYAGVWNGSSLPGSPLQGGTISFTVSNQQTVTSITINYQLNSCAIARTLSGLALPIEPPAVTTGRPLPNFSYGSPAILQQPPNTIVIDATFLPAGSFLVNEDTASGGVSFHDYMGCGSGGFSFSARRR